MNLETLRAKKKEYDEAVKADGQRILKEEFKAFFEKHPEIEAVRWTQYTPHFNDGDACTFGRNEFEFRLVGGDEFLRAYEIEFSGQPRKPGTRWDHVSTDDPKRVAALVGFAMLKPLADGDLDSVFLGAFGDGVEVTVTREAITVEEHEHD